MKIIQEILKKSSKADIEEFMKGFQDLAKKSKKISKNLGKDAINVKDIQKNFENFLKEMKGSKFSKLKDVGSNAGKQAKKVSTNKNRLKNLSKKSFKYSAGYLVVDALLNPFSSSYDSSSGGAGARNGGLLNPFFIAGMNDANKEKYSDKLGKKKKYGPYDNIDELIKYDRKNKDLMSRISNMIYTTNMYIGGYGDKDLTKKGDNKSSELSQDEKKEKKYLPVPVNKEIKKFSQTNSILIDKINQLSRKMYPVVPISEDTGKKIVDSNLKIEELLARISKDMVKEQDTTIKNLSSGYNIGTLSMNGSALASSSLNFKSLRNSLVPILANTMSDSFASAMSAVVPEVSSSNQYLDEDVKKLEEKIANMEKDIEKQNQGIVGAISNLFATVVGIAGVIGTVALLNSGDEEHDSGIDSYLLGGGVALGGLFLGGRALKRFKKKSDLKHAKDDLEKLKKENEDLKSGKTPDESTPDGKNKKQESTQKSSDASDASKNEQNKNSSKMEKRDLTRRVQYGATPHTFGKAPTLLSYGKGMMKSNPLLTLLSAGYTIHEIEKGAEEIPEEERAKYRGSEYTKELSRTGLALAGGAAGGKIGALIGTAIAPGVGTAVGAALGGIVGGVAAYTGLDEYVEDFFENTETGKAITETATSAFKYWEDRDTMSELEKEKVLTYHSMGNTEINRDKIYGLDPETIKMLIGFNDYSKDDLLFLKKVYDEKTGKIKYNENEINETFKKFDDAKKDIYGRIDKIASNYSLNPNNKKSADKIREALVAVKKEPPEKILDPKNKSMHVLDKYAYSLAQKLREIARGEMINLSKAVNLSGKSKDEIERKYRMGKFSQEYLSSDQSVSKFEEKLDKEKQSDTERVTIKSSDVILDHLAEYDDAENAILDNITKKFETVLPQNAVYTGDIRLVGGKALSSKGSKCMGAYTKHKKRGIRNNNPGNIRRSNAQWIGKIPFSESTDKLFEQFVYPEHGIRALALNLKNYQALRNLYTIRGMITRQAPSVENDTASYINAVSRALGISPDTPIDFRNPDVSLKLVKAIIIHENGENPYPDDMLIRSINSALGLQDLSVDETPSVAKYDATESNYERGTGVSSPSNSVINEDVLNNIKVSEDPTVASVVKTDVGKELERYIRSNNERVDLKNLKPEFRATLAMAAKAYYEKYKQKLPIETAYRDPRYQAELYLRKALGDKGIKDECARPVRDVNFPIGAHVGAYEITSKVAGYPGIEVNDGIVTVKGSGTLNAHGNGMAVDIPSSAASKFEEISKQFGLGRPDPIGDEVHFQMFRNGRYLGGSYSRGVNVNSNSVKMESVTPAVSSPQIQESTGMTQNKGGTVEETADVTPEKKEKSEVTVTPKTEKMESKEETIKEPPKAEKPRVEPKITVNPNKGSGNTEELSAIPIAKFHPDRLRFFVDMIYFGEATDGVGVLSGTAGHIFSADQEMLGGTVLFKK